MRRTGISGHRQTAGNVGSMMLVRPEGGEAAVTVISLWESLDAVRRFAGDHIETAVFYPEDEAFLIAKDAFASHREVTAIAMRSAVDSGAPDDAIIPHNVYSDGRVQSLGLQESDGRATVGVMLPGTYRFSTSSEERVKVVSGSVVVTCQGATRAYHAGQTYVVPPGVEFEVEAPGPVAYHCRFIESRAQGVPK